MCRSVPAVQWAGTRERCLPDALQLLPDAAQGSLPVHADGGALAHPVDRGGPPRVARSSPAPHPRRPAPAYQSRPPALLQRHITRPPLRHGPGVPVICHPPARAQQGVTYRTVPVIHKFVGQVYLWSSSSWDKVTCDPLAHAEQGVTLTDPVVWVPVICHPSARAQQDVTYRTVPVIHEFVGQLYLWSSSSWEKITCYPLGWTGCYINRPRGLGTCDLLVGAEQGCTLNRLSQCEVGVVNTRWSHHWFVMTLYQLGI